MVDRAEAPDHNKDYRITSTLAVTEIAINPNSKLIKSEN